MRIKKIIAGITALSLLGGTLGINCIQIDDIISISANAEEEVKTLENGMTYQVFRNEEMDKSIKILSGDKDAETIEIPEEIDGIKVEIIGSEAFSDNTNVKSVVIPKNITKIEDSAFNGCTNLANVTFNEGLKELGTSVFSNTAIETITIPSSLEVVADNQFLDGIFENTKLTTVNFAEGTKSVVGYLFKGCNSITNIAFPETIESIGNYAFYKCNGFEEIDIPSNIAAIGERAFSCCENLKTVKLNEGLKELGAGAFSDTAIETITIPSSLEKVVSNEYSEGIFRNTKLTTVNFAEGTKSVAGYLFKDCSLLENVTFPKDIENIEEYAFKDCTSLNVKIPDTVETIGKSAFEGCTKIKSIEIPDGVKRIEKSTFYGCTNLENVKIPDSVTEIGFCAFADCENLEELTLPKNVEVLEGCILRNTSVKSINIPASLKVAAANESFASVDYAFDGSYIKTAVIDSGMEVIPEGLFLGASKLQTVEIPDTVTTISKNAFSGCESLTDIKIPDSVTKIGFCAFADCENLEKLTLPKNIEVLEGWILKNTSVKSINIPASLKIAKSGSIASMSYAFDDSYIETAVIDNGMEIIPEGLFLGASKLQTVEIPDTVTAISDHAFSGCQSLTGIKIPSGLKSIGNYAFNGCENLKEIELNEGLESLGAFAFRDTGITEIVIPKTVESIYGVTGMAGLAGYSAFEESNVKEVTFAEGATIIPEKSFFGCKSIEKINIPNTVKTIGNNAFSGCENLKEIELPEGIESIGANAFSGTGITSLTIPASLKSGYASAGMIAVGAYSIAEGSNIKEVTFAEGTKKIPYRIFFNCSTLEKVNLPDSVELIGREAFAGCENLSDIIYNKDSDIKCYQDSFKDSGLAEKVPFKILEDSSETATYGDVNVGDDVTIADAVLLNKYLVDSATLSEQGMANADAYYDGRITSDDTLAILKLIVGTYDSLPVNP